VTPGKAGKITPIPLGALALAGQSDLRLLHRGQPGTAGPDPAFTPR